MTTTLKAAPASGSGKSRRYNEGRVCGYPGCGTVLSVYNPNGACFAHADIKTPRLRGKITNPN